VDERPELGTADVGFSLATTRAALGHRAVVLAEDRSEFRRGLAAAACGEFATNVVHGSVTDGKLAFDAGRQDFPRGPITTVVT
jgi:acyl transferase domain-containing protein